MMEETCTSFVFGSLHDADAACMMLAQELGEPRWSLVSYDHLEGTSTLVIGPQVARELAIMLEARAATFTSGECPVPAGCAGEDYADGFVDAAETPEAGTADDGAPSRHRSATGVRLDADTPCRGRA